MKYDLKIANKYFDLYSFLSIQDLKSRFRRSYLGVFWIILQNLIFSLIAGLVWAKIFSLEPANFVPFLAVGFCTWGFISSALTEGCNIFVIAHGYLKQLPLPQEIFILRTLLTHSFYLFTGLLTAISILIFFGKFHIISCIYLIPGLIIILIYFYAASGAMAYLGLRYRDLQHALTSLFALLFIVTPVIYPPEVLIQKGVPVLLYLNPFASLIELIRYPLLYQNFAAPEHYLISIVFTFFMWGLKALLAKKWRRFIPFWV